MDVQPHPRFKPASRSELADWRRKLFRRLYPAWTRLGVARRLKRKRVALMDSLLCGALSRASSILDVGCANGQDFVSLVPDRRAFICGVDLQAYDIPKQNFTFVLADAERLPFPDRRFDVAVSIGAFEHIQPIEKLARAAREVRRVSKAFCVVVPSIGTLLEPHSAELFWHLREPGNKRARSNLNYFSDEAWLKFEAFDGCRSKRFWYIPGLVQGLAIYGRQS